MRIVGEIPHPDCKITLFAWNNRYLIKFELGHLEQTYKINQFDLINENELHKVVSEGFIQQVIEVFNTMAQSLNKALQGV